MRRYPKSLAVSNFLREQNEVYLAHQSMVDDAALALRGTVRRMTPDNIVHEGLLYSCCFLAQQVLRSLYWTHHRAERESVRASTPFSIVIILNCNCPNMFHNFYE